MLGKVFDLLNLANINPKLEEEIVLIVGVCSDHFSIEIVFYFNDLL